MKAIRSLMGIAAGRKYTGMVRETPAGIHAMQFEGPKDVILIVWTDQTPGRRTVEFSKRDLLSATDLMGAPMKQKAGRSGRTKIEIEESSGPVYLMWTR